MMTSRERVLASLNHQQPDRVPIDLSGHRSSGIAAMVYPKLREALGLRHAKMWQRAKELANVKVMLHTCGGVRPLIPDFIESGLDAFNPVQISCTGMEAYGLKKDFGDRITFWGGGCDTRWTLSHATPAEVRKHVKDQVSILAPGGGFVFQQVHNVLADVPPENIIAMLDAVTEYDG
jgi:uroporphyrinogen decarboxylase